MATMTHAVQLRFHTAVAALAVALTGCGDGYSSDSGTGPNNGAAFITLEISPQTASIGQGGSGQFAVNVTRTNYSGTVTLTIAGAPASVSTTISQPQGQGSVVSGLVSYAASASAAPATYSLTIQAAGPGVTTVSSTFSLTVIASGSFTLSSSSSGIAVAPGGSGTLPLQITRDNVAAPITLAFDNLPTGVTGMLTPNPVTGNAATLALSVASVASLGTHTITVRGSTAGLQERTVSLVLTIGSMGTFTLSAAPAPATIAPGGSRAVTITIARGATFTASVTLTVEGPPTGLTFALNPALVLGTSSTLTLTAAANLAVGTYLIAIRGGSSGVIDQTLSLPVQVTP